MTRRQGQSGFTLLEVMIALAILAGGLALSIAATASNVRQAHRAQKLGVATNLARGKMYDIEEKLIKDGFQEMDQNEDGDFSDEGWPDVKWEVTIEKVELPGLGALQAADGSGTGDDSTAPGEATPGSDIAGSAGAFAGAGLIGSQFEMIANVLERSIRRVTLKVTWNVGQKTEDMTVVCYFTNSQGVDEAMSGAPAADSGDASGGDSGGDSTVRSSSGRGRGSSRAKPGPGQI